MSFNDMTLIDLKKIADDFGVESPVKITKQKLISLLEEEGVTHSVYEHFNKLGKETEERKPMQQENIVFQSPETFTYAVQQPRYLVKMERDNFSFQAGRFSFSKEHPYVAMSEAEANDLFARYSGFRLATPQEVQNFYA